uniref:Peptidyl-prolyl cis-trans isomerase n=1 Tax=Cyanothece sp. (strain PCC 7425 / ATCC 29141) TaxID=395961 RepID=B8HUH5_CYAP4
MRSILISLAIVALCTLVLVVAQFTARSPVVIASPIEETTIAMTSDADYTTTPSGLKYRDLVVGTGAMPKRGQQVIVQYTGTLMNGTKFDSSRDRGQPFQFRIGVGQVIKGWDEGVGTMRVGGQRELVIPPDLAYGSRAVGGVIPANSTLKFDVELLGIE